MSGWKPASTAAHTHTESDVTDLDHWVEADHDALDHTGLTGVGGADADAIHDNVAGEISLVTEKVTPVSADLILIEDSAASNAKKRVRIGNLPGGTSSPLTTKGDLYTYSTTEARLGAGTAGQYLTADSAETTGLKWADLPDGAYAETVGDGAATSFALTHSLGTTDLVVQIWDVSGASPVRADTAASSITATDVDTVTVVFGAAPAVDEYRVVIVAAGSGGGGGASAIQPDAVVGLAVWLEADAITGLADTDPLATWPDASGNGNDFTQGVAGEQPLYRTGILNALPVVRFDASNDGMTSSYTLAATYTVIALYRYNGTTSEFRRMVNGSTNWLMGPYSGRHRFYNGSGFAGSTEPVAGGWRVHVARKPSTLGAEHYVDGSFIAYASGGSSPTLRLGYEGLNAEPADSDLAALIVYDNAISASDRRGVEQYLYDKYLL